MANLDVAEFLEETLQSHTGDTNYATAFTVAASEWIANAIYFVVCTARVGGSNGNTVTSWKLNEDTGGSGTDIAESESIFENASGSSVAQPHSYTWWGIYTVPATPIDVRLQHKTFASGDSVHTDAVSLIKVRLDDDLTENTDWRVASNNSLTSLTASFVTFADTGVFTPGTPADHRLILATIRMVVDSRVQQHEFKLQQDIDGAGFTDIGGVGSLEGEDANDVKLYVWGWVDDSGSSGTRQYRIQARNDAGTANDHIYSAIFVLEGNAFESHTEDLITTPLTWVEDVNQILNAVVSYTPASTGNHLVFTNALVNPNGNHQWRKSFEIDDVEVDADFGALDSGRRWDPTDQQPSFRARLLSIDSGGDKLEHMGMPSDTDGTWNDRMLWASSVALAAGGAQVIGVGTLAETDALVPAVPEKDIVTVVGILGETDSLNPVQARKVAPVGTLTEADVLVSIQALKPIITAVGIIGEIDSLIPAPPLQPFVGNVGVLTEIDSLIPAPPLKIARIGTLRSGNDYHVDLDGVSGSFVTTPDHADFNLVDTFFVGAFVAPDDWAFLQNVFAHWLNTGDQRSWILRTSASGAVHFRASDDGILNEGISGPVLGFSIGFGEWFGASFDGGFIRWYVGGPDPENEAWVEIGSGAQLPTITAVHNSTAAVEVGSTNNGVSSLLPGKAHRAVIYSDLSRSTLVASFDGNDFTIGDSDTDIAVDSTGKTWTIHGSSSVVEGYGPQPVQARKVAQVGVLDETDALVSIQALKPIIKAIGTPSESETAQVVIPAQGQFIVVGTASESELAQAIIALKPIIKAIGFASETEVAQVVGVVQPGAQVISVGTAIEVETAQGVVPGKSVVIQFTSESEAAQAVTALKPIIQAIGTVAELESAQGVAAIKPIITPVGASSESESAQIVRYIKVLQIGTATETEIPITVTIIKIVLVGQVSEFEVAQIVVPGTGGLGDAGELLTADDTGKAVAVVVVSKVAVLYDVVKIRS